MNRAASATWAPADPGGRVWLFMTLLVLGSAATAVAAIVGNGAISVTVAPLALGLALVVVWVVPMRLPLFALIFLNLALDATGEGPWDSPLAPLGRLLAQNLNKSIPLSALTFPAFAVILVYLLTIHVHRRLSASATDDAGYLKTAKPMLWGVGASFLAVIGLCTLGVRFGGDIQMAKIQVQSFVLMLLVAYLLAMTLRGIRDFRILGGVVIAAAVVKSLMALWVVHIIVPTPATATTHGDSLLFAAATVLLFVRFAEQPGKRTGVVALMLLPLLTAAMVANNRRLVWIEVVTAIAAFWIVSRRSRLKQLIVRSALIALPIVAAYVAAGWNSQSSVFAPVKLFRSVGDADVDRSTLYRDLENYNLLYTLRSGALFGLGFGHPFEEPAKMDDISFFKEYRYMPHNSVLGLWCYGGIFGFTGLSLALVFGVFLAARSYERAGSADERVAAFMALAMVVIYEIQCWGDIGFSERKSIFLVGPALAIAGQLARSTGAWTFRPTKTRA